MKTLQQIVQDHKSLDQLMLESGGELTDEQQESIVDAWMSEIKSDLTNKIDGYKYRQDALDSASESLKARAKMIQNASKVLTNLSEMLKQRLKFTMLELGQNDLTGSDFKYKIAPSKPSLDIDEKLVDEKYFFPKTVSELDKDAIRLDLEAGEQVSGARLVPGYTLRVSANKKIKEIG